MMTGDGCSTPSPGDRPTGPYARIAVPLPIDRTFHYLIPAALAEWVRPGARCIVPFGRTRIAGFVVGLEHTADVDRLKPVLEVLDPEPCLPRDLLDLGMWLSSYYHHPPGETLSALLPPSYRASSEPEYRLAEPKGAHPPSGAAEARLWDQIRSRGCLSPASVRPGDLQVLVRLVKTGCLTRTWRVASPRAPRPDRWFSLASAAPATGSLARSPRQAQILEVLAGGPLPSWALMAQGVSAAALRRVVDQGWVERRTAVPRASDPSSMAFGVGEGERPDLTSEQADAVSAVARGLEGRRFTPLVLQGVTGSGKTEVYIRAVEETLRRGLGAIVLVPEISLTPQILGRFLSAFQDRVAVLHSGLGERERQLQWDRVRSGEAPIALGTRSAVFAPVPRLGLAVVDEEHDSSYKQEEGLRYHAKHVALRRAQGSDAVVLLGSATPDIETLWAARSRRYGRIVLPRRVSGASLPDVRLVDLRQEDKRQRAQVLLSEPLRREVDQALARGEQVLLFLNRRGFSPALFCPSCGESSRCAHCSISLTLHRSAGSGRLLCHYCGRQSRVPSACAGCGSAGLVPIGAGTQKLMAAAAETWSGARIVRLDRDAARARGGAEILATFHRGEADILVGTQMVAKGHHFPRLTVVGVVDADRSLHLPDFRSAERTFQILTQVAGRAGRGSLAGKVFFQTRNPDHPVIAAAARGDYEAFADAEIEARRETGFPPFRRLALLRISSPEEPQARSAAQSLAREAKQLGDPSRVEVLGPAPAPVERLRGRWRFQVLLRAPGPRPGPLQKVLQGLLAGPAAALPKSVRCSADVDPQSLL